MRRKLTYDPARDYYTLLGVAPDASLDAIRQAYRHRVREVHPDRHPDRAAWATEQIKLLNEAYAVLRHPAQRREYDRLRWPHAGSAPRAGSTSQARTRYRSPFTAPTYDPARPWWEQATAPSPRAGSPGVEPSPALWLAISQWLKARGLRRLDRAWLTLVGLWRSPYASLLVVLSTVLAVNVAFIIYAFITPGEDDNLFSSLRALVAPVSATPPPTETPIPITPTPDRLYPACTDSGVTIQQPVKYETVGDAFMLFGTLDHAGMWHYTVQVGYLGNSPTATPTDWIVVRGPPYQQSTPEESIDGALLMPEPIVLNRSGYYAVRVRVTLQDLTVLPPCDVVVLHE